MQMRTRVRRLVPRQQGIQEAEEQGIDQLSHVRQHGSGQGHNGTSRQDLQEETGTRRLLRHGRECGTDTA